jgi:hypothetical protein
MISRIKISYAMLKINIKRMERCQMPFAPGVTLAIFLVFSLYLPPASAGEFSGTDWKVTPGDTVYSIGRAIYPGDARKQGQLRLDIRRLNPAVFGNGKNRMNAVAVLKLPEYVVYQQATMQEKKQTRSAPDATKSTLVAVTATGFVGTKWVIKSGDTLYAIGRSVYPGNAQKQARLRRDILKLNPSVFANGANNMEVGAVLKLPDYVAPKGAPPKAAEPAHVPIPIPVEATPEPAAPDPVVEPEPETPREVASTSSPAEGGFVVSLGYSYGGDKLVDVDNWLDLTAGSGVNLRLGYEQMPHHASGYRIALGLQYNAVYANNGDASLRDAYLLLAYQYRANPVLYGIGVVAYAGAKLDDDGDTTDYDAANGAVVYLENVGNGKMAGWGLSYTYLDTEEEDTGKSVDASRAELYYSWRF